MNNMANCGVWILLLYLAVGIVSGINNDPQDKSAFAQSRNVLLDQSNKMLWVPSRQRRSTGLEGNCNTWSPWFDKNHPSSSNKNESETIPQRIREQFCPAYGNTDAVQCKDNNGEPFVNDRINSDVEIRVGQNQVTCTLVNPAFISCPNLAIRFKCDCTNTQPASTPSTRLQTALMSAALKTSEPTRGAVVTHHLPSAVMLTKPSTQQTMGVRIATKSSTQVQHTPSATIGAYQPTTQHNQDNYGTHVVESSNNEYLKIGGFRVSWWIAVLVASTILFILNLIITVCLYKKLRNRFHHVSNGNKKIHPLSDI